MTVRALDEDGDIVTHGTQFIHEREEVAQTIRTRLALFLGEYFRNINEGTPWYEQILGKFVSLDVVEAILRARIANTPEVIRILSFATDFDLDARKYSLSAVVLTKYGELEASFNG